ncbi:unnamed protein product [Rangifer tarandus platyrhynchus]|uniref:Uncharacterized protein n=1 Tax=Rangifer tarandus platyrhynchus TaxID=3082113 RepID=A0ABN8YIT1_RANTA|nr:unnamed protein product [Rangifer tarandus platyrhynchus]
MWTGSPGPLSALWLPLPPPPPSEQLLLTAGAPRGARSRDARPQRPLLTAGRFVSGGETPSLKMIEKISFLQEIEQTAIINIHSKVSSLSQHKNFCCSQIYSLDRAQWEQSISTLLLHAVSDALA